MDTEVRDRREDADQARIDGLTARAEAAEAEVERLRLELAEAQQEITAAQNETVWQRDALDGACALDEAERAQAEVEQLRAQLADCWTMAGLERESAQAKIERLRAMAMGKDGKDYDCRTTGERLAVQEDRLQILSDTMRRIVAEIGKRLDALEARA